MSPDDTQTSVADDLRAVVASSAQPVAEVAPVAPSLAPAAPLPSSPAREGTDAAAARARDDAGRFARSGTPKPEPARPAPTTDPAAAAAAAPPPEQPRPGPKAPQSWRAELREKWGSLPPEVQAEVSRRELETSKALDESTRARQLMAELNGVLEPHAAVIQGQHPLEAIDSTLRVASLLKTGTKQQKAQMVASLVSSFGVDVQALDAALAGQPQQPQQPQQPLRDSRLDGLLAAAQQMRAQRERDDVERAQKTLASFAETHEHLPDVEDDMAALITTSRAKGVDLSLEDAYVRACRAHPEVWERLEQTRAAETARTAQAATAQSKAAASSVRSSPVVLGEAPSGSVDDDLRSVVKRLVTR